MVLVVTSGSQWLTSGYQWLILLTLVHVNNIKACMVSIPTCNCCRINIAFPHSKIARGESEKAQAGYVYTDRPAQSNFVAIAFAGLPRPQSNLNIIPVFAVPMLPGICVLKFKMKFYM